MSGRVLVTGASGFIGWHCLAPLRARGFEIHTLGRNAPEGVTADSHHRSDLFKPEDVSRCLETVRPSHLLHLAWTTQPGSYWTAAENLDWAQASLHLLREFIRHGGRRIVSAGTCAEYDWSGASDFDECSSAFRPHSLYGACKLGYSLMAERYCAQADVPYSRALLFMQHGPRERPERLIPQLIRDFHVGAASECRNAEFIRDLLPVTEVGDALAALVHSTLVGPINIASGKGVKLGDLARTLEKQMGRSGLLKLSQQTPPREPLRIVAKVTRLREELGWQPQLSLAQGLAASIHWWTRQPT